LNRQHILTSYVRDAPNQAVYIELDDRTFAAGVPCFRGVMAFALTRGDCERELLSAVEDRIVLGLKLGHPLPVFGAIRLNRELHLDPPGR